MVFRTKDVLPRAVNGTEGEHGAILCKLVT
jgi:hypothetical protein